MHHFMSVTQHVQGMFLPTLKQTKQGRQTNSQTNSHIHVGHFFAQFLQTCHNDSFGEAILGGGGGRGRFFGHGADKGSTLPLDIRLGITFGAGGKLCCKSLNLKSGPL